MASLSLEAKQLRRKRRAWYMYDFGNSAYAAVVLLAVYSAYFKGQVVGGAMGSRLWGIAVGVAMLVVAVVSPVLGAIADFSGSKKRLLFVFTAMACIFTALLFFVEQGDVFIGMAFFILAEIGYRGAQVFYNSLLPEIAGPDDIGRVSGIGWALGSAGGVLCLLIILPLIMIFEGTFMVRLSLVITAAYFALSSIPMFLNFKESGEPKALPAGENYLTLGFKQTWATIRKAGSYREFIKFVVSFLIYNDGVMMAMNFASIIGAVLFGMEQTDLIIFVIVVQVTNVAGAYVLGRMADRMGGKRALVLSILLMVLAIILMFFTQTAVFFFFVGALAGFAMAGMQSVSRTMVGVLSPPGQSAEFYGFFAVAGRTSSFIGPAIYGGVAYRVAQWYEKTRGLSATLAEQSGQRVAILSIGVFLLIGLAALTSVNEQQAREERMTPVSANNPP
ncbi:MAG: MFS transporter [Anaerolineae bacterium]|nr:MFS transporter [Anaerolineae bacterium]